MQKTQNALMSWLEQFLTDVMCYSKLNWVVDMADISSYTIEEQLVARVWVHERLHANQTMAEVMTVFWE